MTRTAPRWWKVLACAALLAAACGDGTPSSTPDGASADVTAGDGPGFDGAGLDGALPDGAPPDGAVAPDAAADARPGDAPVDGPLLDGWGTTPDGGCVPVQCQSHVYACADCMDNDRDGLADWRDPDCLGPCDNSENDLTLGIPGGGSAPCRLDCYFDQDTGAGNDTCRWDHRCDPREPQAPTCAYSPTPPPSAECPATQARTCEPFCRPLVPNGCDCFGCCELPGGSGRTVFLGSTPRNGAPPCTLATAGNPDSCRPCTQVPSCLNRCERCEVCLGRPTPPADCFVPTPPPDAGVRPDGSVTPDGGVRPDGGATPDGGVAPDAGGTTNPGQCPAGYQACGLPGQSPCPFEYYCITGCCVRAPG